MYSSIFSFRGVAFIFWCLLFYGFSSHGFAIVITSPASGANVTVGETVTFGGDTQGVLCSDFTWNFGGAATNQTLVPPSTDLTTTATLNTVGSFTIALEAVGASCETEPAPDTIVLNVNANNAPSATIDTPGSAQAIQTGQSVNFTGSGSDPDNNLPLTYDWNFGGGATNSTAEDPGNVTFNTAGTYLVTFTVTDSLGLSGADTVSITVADNVAPTATIDTPATTQSIQTGQSVSFTGTGNDPDGNLPLGFDWDFDGGAINSNLEDPGAVTFNTAGSYTVTFTVTDSQGLSSNDTVLINVADNIAPTASIDTPTTTQSIQTGDSVSFTGSGNDADENFPLTYNWDFDGGATNSTAEDPGAVTFNTAGSYTVTFTVTDSQGLSTDDIVVVNVADNLAPSATIDTPATVQNIQTGSSVTFTGTGSDADGNLPLSYNWDFDGGAANSVAEDPGAIAFNTAGSYMVTFTVTDSRGLSGNDTVTINVADNLAPTASIDTPASNQSIQTGQSVSFTGSGNDPDGNLPLTFNWDFGGGANNSTAEDPGSVTFDTPGSFTVTFTVTDSQGLSSDDTVIVNVSDNDAPIATIDTPSEQVNIFVGGTVDFSGTGSDPDSEGALTFDWDFDGGAENVSDEDPGEIVFNETGTYQVTFTVTDELGASGSDTQTVVVGDSEGQDVQDALEEIAATPNEESVSGSVVSLCLDAGEDSQLQEDCSALATAAVNGDAGVAEALAQITMDEVSASVDSTLRAATITSSNMNQRFSTLRQGSSGINTGGLTLNVQGQNVPVGALLDGYAFQSGGSAGQEADLGRWGIFAIGSILVGEKDDSDKEAGYDFDTKGLTFGADYRLQPNQIIGAALSIGSMQNDLNQDGGDLEGDNYALILYGTQYAETYYVDSSITFGHSSFDQTRNVRYTLGTSSVDQKLVSDFNGKNLSLTVGGGYQFSQGAFSFGPEMRAEYLRFDIDAFEERVLGSSSSGWAMAIDKQSEEVFKTNVSAFVDYAASFSWGVLVPSAKIDWIHEFQGDQRVVNGSFVGDSTGDDFRIETDVEDTDYFSLALGTSTQLPEGKSAFFNYQTLLGKTDIEQHNFSFGFRWDF